MIHGVDFVQIEQDEEESGCDLTTGSELVSCLVNLLHGIGRAFKTLFNVLFSLLGCLEGLDESYILEQRDLGLLQVCKNLIFKL